MGVAANSLTVTYDVIRSMVPNIATPIIDQTSWQDDILIKLEQDAEDYYGETFQVPFVGGINPVYNIGSGVSEAPATYSPKITDGEAKDHMLVTNAVYLDKNLIAIDKNPKRLFNYMESELAASKSGFEAILQYLLFSDGTTGLKSISHRFLGTIPYNIVSPFYGLGYWISTSPATGSVLGVSRVSNVFLRNYANATATTIVSTASLTKNVITDDIKQCGAGTASNASGKPDMAITTRRIYNYLQGVMAPASSININSVDGAKGFQRAEVSTDEVVIDGCKFYWSDQCTAGAIYYIPTKHVKLRKNAGGVIVGDLSVHQMQVAQFQRLFRGYQLIIDRPGACGIRTNITEA
jgi:hypothetical protein